MDFNLKLPLLFQVVVLMLSFRPTFTSPKFPIAKPGCQDQCGNVSIPFPFGTKEGCYLNQAFSINCTNPSNNAPQPVLKNSTINVTDISLEGQMRVLQFVGYDCYNSDQSRSNRNSPWITLSKHFKFNSSANKFTAVGCDTYSLVRGVSNGRRYRTGCISGCDSKEDVVDGSCSGIGCCQTSIPIGAWEIEVTLSSYDNHSYVWDFNPCSYAFVVEDGAFKFSADNLTNLDKVLSLPVVVDWTIENQTCEEAQKNKSSYACTENAECYVPVKGLGYRCSCKVGYEGNPYLPGPDGCRNINECENPNLYKCEKNSYCNDTVGNYTCVCSEGYHGDGRGGEGCMPDKKNNGKIYWSITGVAISTAVLLACSFCLYSELKRRNANRLKDEFFIKNGGLILQQRITGQGGGTNIAKIFTIEELQKATNNFDESRIIGRGGFGTVFEGLLVDNRIVAIKKSKGVDQHQVEQFVNEMILLSQINNRNVVKLLGCCLETEVPLLVYEFINNGTLFEHLNNKMKASDLSWNIRLRIASEIAGVLSYLHSVASPPIIHRDIKSVNILLDQNYTAKVSDFGISKLFPTDEDQVSTMVQGTHGYLDPEYLQTGLLTEKSDVYSFGVVLVELLTAKRALSSDRPEVERFLSMHFISLLKQDNLVQVLDSNIVCQENMDQLKEVAGIAKKCLNVKGEDRPSMKDVARELEVLVITRATQFPVHVVELNSTESEALLDMESKAYASGGDPRSLFSGTHTITERMMSPIAGGR